MTDKDDDKKMQIVFAPGCFDSFDGTQEELDALIAQITKLAESGELFEESTAVNIDELVDELTDDELDELVESLGIDPEDLEFLADLEQPGKGRTLQ
jgi:sigma54-dependent transcription regulator